MIFVFLCLTSLTVKSLSRVQLFTIPWTTYQAPPFMKFSRQEYWSGLPFPSPGNLPDQGWNPGLPHCGQMLYRLSHQGSPLHLKIVVLINIWPVSPGDQIECAYPYTFFTWCWKLHSDIKERISTWVLQSLKYICIVIQINTYYLRHMYLQGLYVCGCVCKCFILTIDPWTIGH